MPHDYQDTAEQAAKKASDLYHQKVPKKKRAFFWVAILIAIMVVGSAVVGMFS